jgi:hypothetical protein
LSLPVGVEYNAQGQLNESVFARRTKILPQKPRKGRLPVGASAFSLVVSHNTAILVLLGVEKKKKVEKKIVSLTTNY